MMDDNELEAELVGFINAFVGRRFSERREELALPIVEVARLLKTSVDAVIDIEAGRKSLDTAALFVSSKILNVDTNYFFEGLPSDLKSAVIASLSGSGDTEDASCEC